MDQYNRTAISLIDLKETAIYFDRVVPVNLMMEYIWALKGKGELEVEDFLKELISTGVVEAVFPQQTIRNLDFLKRLARVNQDFDHVMRKVLIQAHGFAPKIQGLSREQYARVEQRAFASLTSFVNKFGLRTVPADVPYSLVASNASENAEVTATLASLQLLDARDKSWPEILELRRDAVAREKLRRLRLFAYSNYAGKEKHYIEDDILSRISDYEEAAKQWGFETKHGALTILLNSKTLAAASTAAFMSVLFGAPTAALAALAGGAAIEFGRTALYLGKQTFSFRKALNENPVSFIAYAKAQSDKSRTDRLG